MTDKKMQGWLSEAKNPKIEQTIRLLKINKEFLKDVAVLRKKWPSFIEKHKTAIDKIIIELIKMAYQGFLKKEKPSDVVEKAKKKNLFRSEEPTKENLFTANTKFNQDILDLCEKYKLYPISLWRYRVAIFIVTNDFSISNKLAGMDLAKYLSPEEISQIPEDMNFSLKIEKNKDTKELELFIQVYETTSLRDLKKYWHMVKHSQDKLKKAKKIDKRYYPKKGLETAEKLFTLDKTKSKSDWEKHDAIYGEPTSSSKKDGEKETKKTKNLKRIRYRYK